MTLAKSKTRRSNRTKQVKLTPEQKFQREWQRVQSLQKANQNLRTDIVKFVALVENEIGKQEKAYCEALCRQTHRLTSFIAKKTLPDYQRNELIYWITDNLSDISSNPFGETIELDEIVEQMEAQLGAHRDNEMEKLRKRYPSLDDEEDDDFGEDIRVEENAGSYDRAAFDFEDIFGTDEEVDDEYIDDFFEHFQQEHETRAEQQKQQSQSMDKLLKSTSINQLFRRLARALHPDLVQGEQEKTRRHDLMTELVKARQEKDIVTIMTMYTEHVGEAPEGLFEGGYEQMTQLLTYRVEQLKAEKQGIIMENPRHAAIYHQFHHSSSAKVTQGLQKHRRYLHQAIEEINEVNQELTSLKNLKVLLRDQMVEQDALSVFEELMFDQMNKNPFA